MAYHRADTLFVKSFDYLEGATYPDLGCNFESFTNEEMLEVEALGPLVTLAPDAATEHTEHWNLIDNVVSPPMADEEIGAWIAPLLRRVGI